MNIGYACLTLGVPGADFRSCMQKNADDERLVELIAHNLNSLENIIDYNLRNQIHLFRISSDLIPFASSPVNRLPWWDLFETQFAHIGEKLKSGRIRVSMHPGQYTVLNSPDKSVVERAIKDLVYHARLLDALGTGADHKIVLHIGGIYGDKALAMQRFEENYNRLDANVKRRLIIENDDKAYTIEDALQIGIKLDIPVVFDNLHHQVNPPVHIQADEKPLHSGHSGERSRKDSKADSNWIDEAGRTWKVADGRQKIHYSQQEPKKRPGSHSDTIRTDEFLAFYSIVKGKDIDIMLEVKDKNLSAVKCMNLISEKKEIHALEQEWSRYKYAVLEQSQSSYDAIRALLKEKSDYPATVFYWILEDTFKMEPETGNSINAAQHIWGYFKNTASEQEKKRFEKAIEEFRAGKIGLGQVKRILWKMAEKYQEPYLLDSYYFLLNP